ARSLALPPRGGTPTLPMGRAATVRGVLSLAAVVCACGGASLAPVQEASTSTPVSSCSGIDPPDAVEMQQYVWKTDSPLDAPYCERGAADAKGTVALPIMLAHSSAVVFVDRSSRLLGVAGTNSMALNVAGQPSGFVSVGAG